MKKNNWIFLIAAIVASSVGILSLFHQGFFLTDDGNSMVIRFSAFYEALRSGQFPVRFLSRLNYGYGYPVADFLYPLFMYIGVPIKALGFPFVNTIKIILGLSFLSGTIFSYLWLRKLFDNKAALVGAVSYSLFPYHLFDIYKRGSVGEVLALGIVPFVLWQVERRNFIWTAIGISFLIISHNTLAVLFLIFIFLYGLLDIYVSKNKKPLAIYYISSLIMGLGLSSFFAIPALFDLQYTVFSKTQVSDWSKYFSDFSLFGLSTLVIFLTTAIFIVIRKIRVKEHRLTLLIFVLGLTSILLASPVSYGLWRILPVSFIQFPFRFLSLTVICVSFLSACIVSVLKGTSKIITAVLILVLIFLSSREFFSPKTFQNYPDTFYSTNQDSTTVKNEYMPKWITKLPVEMASSKVVNIDGKEKINTKEITPSKIEFDVFLVMQRTIRVNTVYFPGWNVYVNGKKSNIIEDGGLISFNLNKGSNNVSVKFEETPVRLAADLISALSLLVIFGLYFKKYDKVYKK